MTLTSERLALLRAAMLKDDIDFFIITMTDPHLSENLPDHWQIIKWLTGFTGSAATVVVTGSFAGLWTDSRYFLQAERQMAGTAFQFIRPGAWQRNDYMDYIVENVLPKQRIGFDGRTFSVNSFRRLMKRVEGISPSFVPGNEIINSIWVDRPPMPFSSGFDHPVKYCGKERFVKIDELRQEMRKSGADFHLLTSPEDIMWLLNIRGADLQYTPVLLSYALAGLDQILLFVDEAKIPLKLASLFDSHGIVVLPYEDFDGIIPEVTEGHSLMLNPQTTSVDLFNSVSKRSVIIEDIGIPARMKALKNNTEIENIEKSMVKDGVALTRFFHWFENNHGTVRMSEASVAEKNHEFRSQQSEFLGLSFPTIVAWNENSALPHYRRGADEGAEIGERGLMLVDSGSQYMGGTTDITRTIAVGVPSESQKKDFTLILKGHINLALAKFPQGTRGYQLDLIARRAMWGSGMNYAHGTGHGVGFCLNVHEGPQSISPADNRTVLESGMLTSNEPAIYREGEYGIRTENLILCFEDEITEFGHFLRFDTVSLCYIDRSLIDKSLLEDKEIEWLNSYHSEVYDKISPFLGQEEKEWLRMKTEAL